MNSAIENCKVVLDTIHFVSYDTIHQVYYKTIHHVFEDTVHKISFDTTFYSLDTSLSFEALKNAQSWYNAIYTNAQNDMSNIIMIFAFIVAVLTLIFGANFIWQNGAGIRFFKKNVKELNATADKALIELKLQMIAMHIEIGTQFLKNSNGVSSQDSLEQFYFALTYLIRLDFKNENIRFYKLVLNGIIKNQIEAKSTMQQCLVNSLYSLKEKVKNKDENLNKIIDNLVKILELDESPKQEENIFQNSAPKDELVNGCSTSRTITSTSITSSEKTDDIADNVNQLEDDIDSDPSSEESARNSIIESTPEGACSTFNAVASDSNPNSENTDEKNDSDTEPDDDDSNEKKDI